MFCRPARPVRPLAGPQEQLGLQGRRRSHPIEYIPPEPPSYPDANPVAAPGCRRERACRGGPVQRLSYIPAFDCPGNHLRGSGCRSAAARRRRRGTGLLPAGHKGRESRRGRTARALRSSLTGKCRLRPDRGYGSHATTARTEAQCAPGRRPVHRCCGPVQSGPVHLRDAAAMTKLPGPGWSAQPRRPGWTRTGLNDRVGESAARPC